MYKSIWQVFNYRITCNYLIHGQEITVGCSREVFSYQIHRGIRSLLDTWVGHNSRVSQGGLQLLDTWVGQQQGVPGRSLVIGYMGRGQQQGVPGRSFTWVGGNSPREVETHLTVPLFLSPLKFGSSLACRMVHGRLPNTIYQLHND